MKRVFSLLFIMALTFGFYSESNAQLFGSTSKVGTTAAQFLKIGAGARAVGMGGAFTALDDDIYSIYWNPAGIATSNSTSMVTFNHAEWLADMSFDFAAGSINLGEMGTLFASITTFQVPEDKVRTFQNPEGDGRVWDAGSMSIGMGYAKMLTDRFSVGIHAKYIHESVWNTSASGFAFDVGTLYRTPFNDLMIGASISNFGTKMSLDGRDIQFNTDPNNNINSGPNNIPSNYQTGEFDLPLTFRIGLAMDVVETRYFRFTAALDATHPNDNTEYVNSGMELAYDEVVFFRAGYKTLFMDNSEGGLSLGGGLKYGLSDNFKVFINYAYTDFGRLENIQFFDIGLIF